MIDIIKDCLVKILITYKASKKWNKMSDEEKNLTEAKDIYYEVAEKIYTLNCIGKLFYD